ncbi:MAG: ParA family protein [Okeania sp. SIO3I5]|uniref:ParA family protein n=1 Tax=Okeania sp. SIO3I5 TaxID=2607805 RepID=UPI0013B62129|nr:ParA family protein [Okeania sp. SIO3I5]NEQ35701.1 ParA family protein [Okeania sp. SIO3I5]
MKSKSYVIWNNKGGVGKSTICFHLATVYAAKNPDKDIVVIDMCPQANVSMMLLGGGNSGEEKVEKLISEETPKSVVGYMTDSIINNFSTRNLQDFLVKVNSHNDRLSSNLFLLCGDGNLELIAPLLADRANATPLSQSDKPWDKVHSILKDVTDNAINKDRETVFFIDTNPSFSIYTQIAIISGEKLIIPINADDSSRVAISALFNLIYGSGNVHPVYGNYAFSARLDKNKMRRPIIHLLLGNRFTQRVGAAHAFKALSEETATAMHREYKKAPARFSNYCNGSDPLDFNEFHKQYVFELRDFNSAGVVAANQGLPLNEIPDQRKYEVYGQSIQVSKEQGELCKEVIEDLANKL